MAYPVETRERFIKLRKKGLSYSQIAAETGINKKTLLAWGKKMNTKVTGMESEKIIHVLKTHIQKRRQQLEQTLIALNCIAQEIEGWDLNRLNLKSPRDVQKYLKRRKQNILMEYDSAITQEISDKNDSSQTIQPNDRQRT